MSTHTPWKNPPVLEVVFELRFQPVDDYAIFVGGMAAAMSVQFPNIEKLPGSDFPPFAPIEGVVRHKFLAIDKKNLFQTGQDVISVNSLNYIGFNEFREQIRLVIDSASKFIDFSKSTKRVALRYINKFEQSKPNNNIFSALTIKNPFDEIDQVTTTEISLRRVKQEGALSLATNILYPVVINNTESNLILDIEAFYLSPSLDKSSIINWCTDAHEIISNNFQNLISNIEKELRQ